MTITSRLNRIGRLAFAPMTGFFSWKTRTINPHFDHERTTLCAHLKEVARRDTILYFEPFTNAVREFKKERAKP